MKKQICNKLITGVLIIALTGCAGRSSMPISVNKVGDKNLACDYLDAEKIENQNTIQDLESELARAKTTNIVVAVASGVVGLFIWPALAGLFALDVKTGETVRVEKAALTQRNRNLDSLITNKNCPV